MVVGKGDVVGILIEVGGRWFDRGRRGGFGGDLRKSKGMGLGGVGRRGKEEYGKERIEQ